MTDIATSTTRRPGRACNVCLLAPNLRTQLEQQLAAGVSISRLSRGRGAPSRHSIARHIRGGHLPQQIEERVLRLTGLDSVAVASRVLDIARRARTSALVAEEQNNHAALARAGDSELRALLALVAMRGPDATESEIEIDADSREIAKAVFTAARLDAHVAATIQAALRNAGHVHIADELSAFVSRISSQEIHP
ncbi:hypothetical protein ABXJ56_12440 [Microbacterium chocolatum]|uniref:hypothetical protein n=1 Tax=Microbacterium aurantiacum TaxID=162393 RepID=UPI00338F2967